MARDQGCVQKSNKNKERKTGQAAKKKIRNGSMKMRCLSFVAPFLLERRAVDSVELTSDDKKKPWR